MNENRRTCFVQTPAPYRHDHQHLKLDLILSKSQKATLMTPELFQTKFPHLWATLIAMKLGSTIQHDPASKAAIANEAAAANVAAEVLGPIVDELFADAKTPDQVMRFSAQTYLYLGMGDDVRQFMGRLWAELMRSWTKTERMYFLQLTVKDRNDVFAALDFASEMLREIPFTAQEALPWLAAAHQLIANDYMQRGFWRCVETFCTRNTYEAILTVESWLRKSPEAPALGVIAVMLGSIRMVIKPSDEIGQRFAALEHALQIGHPTWRALYIRSWAYRVNQLNEDRAVAIRDSCVLPDSEEETAWISLLSSVAKVDQNSWTWVFRELRKVARTTLPDSAKNPIAGTVFDCIERSAQRDVAAAKQWLDLLIAILPISETDSLFWQAVERHLETLATANSDLMRLMVKTLAQHTGQTWLKIAPGIHFGALSSVLQEKGLHTVVCGDLCFADSVQSRRLGLWFFDKYQVQKLAQAVIDSATPSQMELLLLEAQRLAIDSDALARLHASLAERVDQLGGDLQYVLYDEVALQALNTYEHRSTLAAVAPNHEYLGAILQDVEERLKETRNAAASPAVQMEVPHWREAEFRLAQRMQREINSGVEKHSVFLKLVTRVTLLYGKKWRVFYPDGTLSEPSGLQELSNTFEVPRLDLVDPEGMQLRRLNASARIAELERR
jgi:hypothetical protein